MRKRFYGYRYSEIGRNPVSKHQIQPAEYGDEPRKFEMSWKERTRYLADEEALLWVQILGNREESRK